MKALVFGWLLSLAAAMPPLACAAPDEPATPPVVVGHQVLLLLRLPSDHYRPEAAYSGGYG
ncbi:MAG TPA: hypothetical protein VIY30_18150, partial [Burkholderiaceae bacterium]